MTDGQGWSTEGKYREALALHRQSRLVEAEEAYRQILEREPTHVQALTFMGVVAFQNEGFELAVSFTRRALDVDPCSVANLLLQGHAESRLGRDEAATASYDRAIALSPGLAAAWSHRGDALYRLDRLSAALLSYDKALEFLPGAVNILNNRGNVLRRLERYADAIVSYESAIAIAPQRAELYFNRGIAQHELKRYDEALASYEQAVAINPHYAEAYYARGNTLTDMKHLRTALGSYDRAISLRQDYPEAYDNRANVLCELGDLDAALANYDVALSLAPRNPDTWFNRGRLLCEMGRHKEALNSLDQAVTIAPDHAIARFTRATVHLRAGDLEQGWREYEWRWEDERCVTSREKRSFPRPLWRGGEVPGDKTILVHCEQGLGDTIQFCRYVTLLAARAAQVIFEVPAPLYKLLRTLQGVDKLVIRGEVLPHFDYYCPLLSLPLAFETDLHSVPSKTPYLRANPERLQHWSDKLGVRTRPRVGLVWSAGIRPDLPQWSVNDLRNIPLEQLAAVMHPEIEFYSLQKGQPAEDELGRLMACNREGSHVVNHARELSDFNETAALVEHLDLVISVDTSIAHLSAAIGKPVWILCRFNACWRWLSDRNDSPWYPTARLYRQRRRGDWAPVVQQVRRDLERVMLPDAKH